jgi:hypothetical protein
MTDEKQIEEMAKDLNSSISVMTNDSFSDCLEIAKFLNDLGYRKLPENAVVLTYGEYSDLLSDEVEMMERDIAEYWATEDVATVAKELYKDGYRKLDDYAIMVLRKARGIEERIRKQTATEILKELKAKQVICSPEEDNFVYMLDIKELAKQYGVEVEE